MKILKVILPILVIILSIYLLISRDLNMLFLSEALLGLFFLVIGIEELKKKSLGKWVGWMLLVVAILLLIVSALGFLVI